MQGDGVRELLAAAREMGCDYLENEPMRLHTTFKIGGPARVLLFPETEEQITALVQCARANGVRLLTIGNGSNLLVADKGIGAAVLVMDKHFSAVTVKGDTIFAQAGASLMKVCRTALEHSLTGLEFAYGIPDPEECYQFWYSRVNDGYRRYVDESIQTMTRSERPVQLEYSWRHPERGDVLVRCTHIDRDGKSGQLAGEDLHLSYRHSAYYDNGCIITGLELRLQPGDPAEIKAKMDDLIGRRREKQPIEYPSAGSTFKRPPGHFAGALIDQCGLRGTSVGGARVSEKHAGFVINTGGATCADVLALCRQCREKVLAETGVELEMEIRVTE